MKNYQKRQWTLANTNQGEREQDAGIICRGNVQENSRAGEVAVVTCRKRKSCKGNSDGRQEKPAQTTKNLGMRSVR